MSALAKSLNVTTTQKQVPLSKDIFSYKEDFYRGTEVPCVELLPLLGVRYWYET